LKIIYQIFAAASLLASCSDKRERSPEQSPVTDTSAVAPTTTPSNPPPKTESDTTAPQPISLVKLSVSDSSQPRTAAKLISVQVRPLKLIGNAFKPSNIVAKCGDEVLVQSNFTFQPNGNSNAYIQPSLTLPADVLCASSIDIILNIFGFTVEVGQTSIADVIPNPAISE
jgi:hypothetical protein